MVFLQIRKKYNNVWLHISNNGEFMISEFYFKIDDNGFQIVERGGARRFIYSLSEITVYDDINGGSAETFTTAVALYHRLVELEYTGVADVSGGGGGTLTLEQARQNGDTINGNIKVSFELENKQSTNLAQVVDVTGKTVSFSDSDTITANFAVNYFENESVDIETFTLPEIIGNEDKLIYFVNKSDELCTFTSNGIDEIWYKEELLSIEINPKCSVILRNNGTYWVVVSLFQSLEEVRELNNIVKGRIIGNSVFTSKTSEDFAQIGDVNTAVSSKAPINNPTFTGSVKVPNATNNNEAVALGQVLKNQITKSGNQTLDNTYNGKVVTFTGSGTFTVNNTIAEEGSFALKVETGVTVAWAITSPATWRVGGLTVGTAPRSLVGGDMVYVARKGSSNEIEVYGL